MKKSLFSISMFTTLTILSGVTLFAQAPDPESKQVNFRYSQNPKSKTKGERPPAQNSQTPNPAVNTNPPAAAASVQAPAEIARQDNSSIARKTLEIAKKAANAPALVPTEVYKVGLGDVLFINLQNASKASYYTVLNDGTIDYPLSGEMIPVSGLTTEQIENLLKDKIRLYENPQISVKVRDYASHSINILGLVEKAGEKKIQREAIPLFIVKADAVVQAKAAQVVIRRTNSTVETLDLKDSKTDDVLIFPGDIVEFTAPEAAAAAVKSSLFYYIGGAINAGGQKEFHAGITLSQAILASGGLRRQTVKKVIVRRKNAEGLLISTEYNLKDIRDGKIADPLLQSDDTVETGQ